MQLSYFSDFGLRVLMLLSQLPESEKLTIPEISRRLGLSEDHLRKIIHFLAKNGFIESTRGKGGGIAFNKASGNTKLGDLVSLLEGGNEIIDCKKKPCIFSSKCLLKGYLERARNAFYRELNKYQFNDISASKQHFLNFQRKI